MFTIKSISRMFSVLFFVTTLLALTFTALGITPAQALVDSLLASEHGLTLAATQPPPAPNGAARLTTTHTSFLKPDGSGPSAPTSIRRYWDVEPGNGTIVQAGNEQVTLPGPNDQVRVIVQLRGEPLATMMLRALPDAHKITAAQATQFRAYQGTLEQAQQQVLVSLSQQGIKFQVKRRYTYLINATALAIKQADWAALQKTLGVLAVYPDYIAQVTLQDSVPLIGAPTVWTMTGPGGLPVTGMGIRVAIIDTGVDYARPDLGVCFGPGCKVMGGYDFVNNDTNPMDDDGHGTHVAGIVAANGVLKGVAPDAKLLAYKVCDASGNCSYSTIIAALERAADPDQNPLTSDAVDVANLSLGGPGDPNDVLSQAVDTAVAQGIVVVVAAGNSGSGYQTIGSPGVARSALTVAASDKTDAIAYFSSRGPVSGFYDIVKPDITAPGVAIYSTVPTTGDLGDPSGYRQLSGTSMATPHVAGAAALLAQLHPTWTPAMIKAALMNTAKDLGQSVHLQGAGRVNVAKAASSPVLIDPPSLGLGMDDLTLPVWSVNRAVSVTNNSAATKTFALSAAGNLPAGAVVTLTPASFSLNPGQSRIVDFSLTVDNSLVPNAAQAPYTYEDKLIVTSGAESWNVPLIFVKSPILNLTFDSRPTYLIIHDRVKQMWQYFPSGNSLTALLPAGDYDVIAWWVWPADKIVVKEHVLVSGITSLYISGNEASHAVHLQQVDENGQAISPGDLTPLSVYEFVPKSFDEGHWFWGATTGRVPLTWYFNDISDNYQFEIRLKAELTATYYDFYHVLRDGITQSMTLQNDPAAFKHLRQQYFPPPGTSQITLTRWLVGGWMGGWLWTEPPLSAPFVEDAYYMPAPWEGIFKFRGVTADNGGGSTPWRVSSPLLYVKNSSDLEMYYKTDSPPPQAYTSYTRVVNTTSDFLPIGLTPPVWNGAFSNTQSAVRLTSPIMRMYDACLFMNQAHDCTVHGDPPYTLYKNGNSINVGVVKSTLGWNSPYYADISLPAAGIYTLAIPYTYFVGAYPGQATATATFDTSLSDRNPPTLYALNILQDGQPTNTISPLATNAVVRFEVGDDESGLNSVTAEYAVGGVWQPLGLQSSNLAYGSAYTASLPLPDNTYVSLRLTAVDASGNRLVYEMDPAYAIGSPTPIPTNTVTPTRAATATQTVTPTRTPTKPSTVITLQSVAAQDGWVLESSETSNAGGSINSSAATFYLGDSAAKQQYRGILSFNTGSLPDNAVITGVTLKVKQQAIVGGGNPAATFGGFMFDVKKGFFGTAATLQSGDFQAAGSASYGPSAPAPVGGWYSFNLTAAKAYVNKLATGSGLTQIRLRFKLDDNNNAIANYLSLYSGNTATAAYRPQLVITYYVPDVLTNITRDVDAFSLRCSPSQINFSLTSTHPAVTGVIIFYRVVDKSSTLAPPIMIAGPNMVGDKKGHFTLEFKATDVKDDMRIANGWFEYQFVGINNVGNVVGRSDQIVKQVTYTLECP